MTGPFSPGSDYDAALKGAAVGSQGDRRFLEVTGRAPRDMLNGLISNSLPGPSTEGEDGARLETVTYSALLNAKGKMISDLRVWLGEEEGFLLDFPQAGFEGAQAHFKKFLPPRLAKVEDRSEEYECLILLGPEASGLLVKAAEEVGVALGREGIVGLEEGEVSSQKLPDGGLFRVARDGDYQAEAWTVLLPSSLAGEIRGKLERFGAEPLSELSREILRVEKGRPAFGKDMDDSIIPVEAGLENRAIDNEKGCYVGQEVVIRIRDRGQVNKKLRGLLLGDMAPPPSGQELFQEDREKSVGWITTAVPSPSLGQVVALAYLKRGVDRGHCVRVGEADGPQAEVRALSDEGWVLE
jgi:folate-binding protein YgfZ